MSQENQSIPLRDQVADFLQKYRVPLIALFGGILVAILGIGIYSEVYKGIYDEQDKNLLRLEQYLGEMSQEIDATNEEDQSDLIQEIQEEINARMQSFSVGQLKQRGYIYSGELFFAKEKYDIAKQYYNLALESLGDGLYASAALYNLAITEEKLDNLDLAIENFQLWIEKFSDQSQIAPEALFTIASLQEKTGNDTQAIENYNRLINDYPGSNWTNVARSRILGME